MLVKIVSMILHIRKSTEYLLRAKQQTIQFAYIVLLEPFSRHVRFLINPNSHRVKVKSTDKIKEFNLHGPIVLKASHSHS